MTSPIQNRQRKLQIDFKLPQNNSIVSFPAFITDLSDDFTSTWNSEQYYGIQDPIGNFVGTSRKINCSIKIIAASADESYLYQRDLNELVQALYPRYDENTIPKSSPLIGVKFANIIRDNTTSGFLFGWLDGVSLTPNIGEAGFSYDDFGNKEVFFRSWDFSFGLNVIHKERPGFKGNGFTLGNPNTFPVKQEDNTVANARGLVASMRVMGDAGQNADLDAALLEEAKLPNPNKAAGSQPKVGPNQ